MTSNPTITTDLILRLICAAGFIHGRAASPVDGLGGSFSPRPFGPSYHGAEGGRKFHADCARWDRTEASLIADWAGRQANLRSLLLDAHRSAAINYADAAIAHLEAAEAIRADWDPVRGFVARRNQWIGVARRALADTLTAEDEKLIASKLDRCLANAAAAKAAR